MFCSKCGAAVTGRYCSKCGQRIRSQMEEFRLNERRRKAAFLNQRRSPHFTLDVADACWRAADNKFDLGGCVWNGLVSPDAYDRLEKVEDFAGQLYARLVEEVTKEGGQYAES